LYNSQNNINLLFCNICDKPPLYRYEFFRAQCLDDLSNAYASYTDDSGHVAYFPYEIPFALSRPHLTDTQRASIFFLFMGMGLYRQVVFYTPCCCSEVEVESVCAPSPFNQEVRPPHRESFAPLAVYGIDNCITFRQTVIEEDEPPIVEETTVHWEVAVALAEDCIVEYTRSIADTGSREACGDKEHLVPLDRCGDAMNLYQDLYDLGLRCDTLRGGTCCCGYCPKEVRIDRLVYSEIEGKRLMLVDARRFTGIILPESLSRWMIEQCVSHDFRKIYDTYIFLDTGTYLGYEQSVAAIRYARDKIRHGLLRNELRLLRGWFESQGRVVVGGQLWSKVLQAIMYSANKKFLIQPAISGLTQGWPHEVMDLEWRGLRGFLMKKGVT